MRKNEAFPQLIRSFESKTLSDLLTGSIFTIPHNQRLYSWAEEKWQELFEDLMDIYNEWSKEHQNKDSLSHFLGPMFFVDHEGKKEVLDGQQRLVTLTILLSALFDFLDEIRENAKQVRFSQDAAIQLANIKEALHPSENIQRVQLSERNNSLYSYLMRSRESPLEKMKRVHSNKSEFLIRKSYKYFFESIIKQYLSLKRDVKDLKVDKALFKTIIEEPGFQDFVSKLSMLIFQGFYVLQSIVPSKEAGYEMFETLNQRGEKLLTVDLFKNFLFEKFVKPLGDEDLINSFWGQLVQIAEEESILKLFLRHFWLSKYEFVREKKLFISIRHTFDQNYKNPKLQDFNSFTGEILREAKVYF